MIKEDGALSLRLLCLFITVVIRHKETYYHFLTWTVS